MCQPDALILENRPRWNPDEAHGGRLRHWGRAALELRRVRRASARIPLRGNPGSASTSKVPGKASREPGSSVTRAFSESFKKASKAVTSAGAATRTQEEEKSPSPPQSSVSLWQVGGQGLGVKGDKRDRAVSDNQLKLNGKTLDQANYSQKKKKKERIEGRSKIKPRLAPSLRSYFRARPEDIVLVPGQGKMDTPVVKNIGNGIDSGKGVEEGSPSLVDNLTCRESIQVGSDASMACQGGNLSTPRQEEEGLVELVASPPLDQSVAPDLR
ncbi:hypothetical protein NDU88_004715 [Pleurodeles waltl]|uniref:Uncharacterized protein n=1 Tax=Pleurodeles waltl TaxID=8319 RepID=A0AAV7WWJ2_PLEWA|nr:hypothetical protein NDU88_004715 [Pleurodeles waltl]